MAAKQVELSGEPRVRVHRLPASAESRSFSVAPRQNADQPLKQAENTMIRQMIYGSFFFWCSY